jgi:hypothetical protein
MTAATARKSLCRRQWPNDSKILAGWRMSLPGWGAQWCLSQSRSAALRRVCQPSPFSRNAARTSASSRIVVDTFRVAARGRPRRTGAAASLAAHSGADKSGASSGSTQAGTVELLFGLMRFPHRDNAAIAISRRPHHDHHPAVQIAEREKTILTSAVGRNGQGGTGKHFSGKRHIQAATLERDLALRRIEGDFHQ